MDQEVLEAAIAKQFGGKAKAIELNAEAARLGRAYCKEELTKSDAYAVEARDVEDGGFFIEGNEAVALGSIFGGVQMLSWYPITPHLALRKESLHGYHNSEHTKVRPPTQYFKQKTN